MSLEDLLGWLGSMEILVAFGLNSFQKIKAESLSFQVLNFSGGIFLIVNSLAHKAYPFTFINAVWVTISLASLIRMAIRKRKSS
jgi:hypothetical protein